MNGHDVAPGVETAIIRKDKKKKVAMKCALFTSGIGICPGSLRRSRAAKLTGVKKKKKRISGGVPVGCQSLDEQIILPSNFHRDSFDHRILSSIPPPYFYPFIFSIYCDRTNLNISSKLSSY